ncbi:biotin transporter BioY [Parachlamydia sp. AcF125]|uniref:biotin transporter BioY n=1 Tax=Parachlamydia sp. AcF125 TaxID=2795736 RepID=UPI001BC8F8B4|nr:biotin transporter BioY [Parachlamydia sp. AcF125]MBS4167753.1 Biotin transporter BioY2 [Parachlamydia sp. AcF125]
MQTLTMASIHYSPMQRYLQIVGSSFLLALSAQISIPLPFSPVPLTLQTLAALLIGAKLGPINGAYAVMLYLAEICLGCPFLAGGMADPTAIIGLKGGYLVGMVVQAYLMGFFVSSRRSSLQVFAGGCIACLIQLFLGTSWLSVFIGWEKSLLLGFVPFIMGEMGKAYFVSKLVKNS